MTTESKAPYETTDDWTRAEEAQRARQEIHTCEVAIATATPSGVEYLPCGLTAHHRHLGTLPAFDIWACPIHLATLAPARPAYPPTDPRNPAYLTARAERLTALLGKLRDLDGKRDAARRSLSDLNRELCEISDDIRMEVADEVNEQTGKLRYSNAESRQAAVSQQLRASGIAQVLTKRINEVDTEIAELSADFEAARRERTTLHTLLEFGGAWLAWQAAATDAERE